MICQYALEYANGGAFMKRHLIYAALSLCLLLAGCSGGQQEQPAPTPAPPGDPVVADPAPEQEDVPAPVEEPQVEIEQPVETEPPFRFRPGIWLAQNDVGYSNYYHFEADTPSGSYVSLEYGLGMPFTYEGPEEDLIFRLEGQEDEKNAAVSYTDDENFTLNWTDSLPEKLSFVGEGTLEDYPFYCNAELSEMALDHYAVHYDIPTEELEGLTGGAMTNVDNTVTIQLYENLGDHNSTAAWYVVDRFTATGTDLTSGEEIDLLDCRMDEPVEDAPIEDAPAEEPSTESPEAETGALPETDQLPDEICAET